MARPRPEDPRFSYADYQQWSFDERWELVDGVPFDMSPAPTRRYQQLVLELAFQVRLHLEGHRCQVYTAPFDVRLGPREADDEAIVDVVQPDLVVVCDPTLLDDRGCHGAPDWIVEVLSPRTAVRDQTLKRDLYERHGVREYWIVDPDARTLVRYVREGEGFVGERTPAAGRTPVSVLPGLEIDWDRAFATT